MKYIHGLAGLALAGAVAGCASPYGRNGAIGGYTDTRLDASHYRVRYDGNGYTSQQRVWSFWIYRCAELTKQKGFEYFVLLQDWKPPVAPAPSASGADAVLKPAVFRGSSLASRPAVWGDDGSLPRVQTRGGSAPGYIYIPGGTVRVTTWHTNAVVAMYNAPMAPELGLVMRAQSVLDDLGSYVRHDGLSSEAVERDDLMRHGLRWIDEHGQPADFTALKAQATPVPAPVDARKAS